LKAAFTPADAVFLRHILADSRPGQLPSGLTLASALRFALKGFRPIEVVRYGLDRGSPPDHYLSERQRLRLQARTASPADDLLHDKLVFHTVLPAVSDLVCKPRGLIVKGVFLPFQREGTIDDPSSDLDEMLAQRALVVKPVRGAQKRGVLVLERLDQENILVNGTRASRTELRTVLSQHTWSLVTDYARQAPYAEAIAPGLSNPIRVLSLRSGKGAATVISASHQFSTRRSCTGPGSEEGAVRAGVDVQTGRLGPGSSTAADERPYFFTHHPETGAAIEGVEVPGWADIRSRLETAHEKLPLIPSISWDLVVSGSGPKVVEAERALSPRVYQRHQPLFTHPFFLSFAREHAVPVTRSPARAADTSS